MCNTYGVVNRNGEHIDVSLTERGAKCFATRNGYDKISVRYNCGYHVDIVSVKNSNGYWVKPDNN